MTFAGRWKVALSFAGRLLLLPAWRRACPFLTVPHEVLCSKRSAANAVAPVALWRGRRPGPSVARPTRRSSAYRTCTNPRVMAGVVVVDVVVVDCRRVIAAAR